MPLPLPSRLIALVSLLVAAAVPASAGILQDWTFDDASGVSLSGVANAARGGVAFGADFANSVTNGKGQFVVKRPTAGVANSYADIPDLRGRGAKPVWLEVRVLGWSFAGTAFNETMRVGFSTNAPESSPSMVAGISLKHVEDGVVELAGDALGEGAQGVPGQRLFTKSHNIPVNFGLRFDPTARTFALFLSADDGATWQKLGEGVTSPERTARHLRLGLSGGFNLRNDILVIDRITLRDDLPSNLP